MEPEHGISITTTVEKAIKAYPYTKRRGNSAKENSLLEYFFIEFHQPRQHQAILSRKLFAPEQFYFSLFDESEKEAMEDEYAFYGVMYTTSVGQARKRVKLLLKKFQREIAKTQMESSSLREEEYTVRRIFSKRDELKDMEEALELFNETDKITLSFNLDAWPEMDELKKKEYVEEFKKKLLSDRMGERFPF